MAGYRNDNVLFLFSRLEQASVVSIERLLVALSVCSKLERICIIGYGYAKPPGSKTIIDVVRKLERLVFLCIEITSWTQRSCKQLTKVLKDE